MGANDKVAATFHPVTAPATRGLIEDLIRELDRLVAGAHEKLDAIVEREAAYAQLLDLLDQQKYTVARLTEHQAFRQRHYTGSEP